jgi:hypothetical protein
MVLSSRDGKDFSKVTRPMHFIFLFWAPSFSYFCRHTITISSSAPLDLSLPAGDGDFICVNSTIPYLSVIFQYTNLLAVRYFLEAEDSTKLTEVGSFIFPSEATGVFFGNASGHVELQSFLPGLVSIAALAFPPDCANNRLISTIRADTFTIGARFPLKRSSDSACLWSPHSRSSVSGEASSTARSLIKLCNSGIDCTNPFRGFPAGPGHRQIFVNSTQFLVFNARAGGYIIFLRTISKSLFLDTNHLLPVSSVPAGQIPLFVETPPPVPVRIENRVEPEKRRNFPLGHAGQKEAAKELTSIELASVLCVVALVVIALAQCFVCPRPKAKRVDGSEERLLENCPPGMEQPMGMYGALYVAGDGPM